MNANPDERISAAALTEPEQRAMHHITQFWNVMTGEVIGHGSSREGDCRELCDKVHVLQQLVMSQVAGRLFPDEYRMLGEVIDRSLGKDAKNENGAA